ncbi:MAG: glucose-6-phosphate dehydrogenase [Thermodesulfobacteriota bacterium]
MTSTKENGPIPETKAQASEVSGGGFCIIDPVPEPFALVIFGASGDLTKRKLIPSLYSLYKKGLLPERFFILGAARTKKENDLYRKEIREWINNTEGEGFNDACWQEFSRRLYYQSSEYGNTESFKDLSKTLSRLEGNHNTKSNRLFYLATPPSVYETIIENLGLSALNTEGKGWSRIVIEKPFGRDLESARKLNQQVHKHFREDQVYRIDHYLGKETVQNILIFRFANAIFEPIWNYRYVDHVQITAVETLGVEQRAGYYEQAGILRDMFQNHMLQLLALTAMEPPAAFESNIVRDEKVKVFRSLRPFPSGRIDEHVVVGQYGEGEVEGTNVPGYREEPNVNTRSSTPTFAAARFFIDNWRWQGVPFYMRSGKRMPRKFTEIAIQFKQIPHLMFKGVMDEHIGPNVLVFRIQPDEEIMLTFQTKKPGSKVCLQQVVMDFRYASSDKGVFLDAYERVLLDCMLGDHMLFVREDGMELTWSALTPVLETIESPSMCIDFPNYASGSSGPEEADILLKRDGRRWRPL